MLHKILANIDFCLTTYLLPYEAFLPIKFLMIFLLLGCKTPSNLDNSQPDFIIAFGSCNNQELENNLWPAVLKQNPNVWVWGGDNIYSDTYDMEKWQWIIKP